MSECVVRMEMPKDCQYCAMAHWDLRDILSGCDAAPGKRYLQGKDDEFWENGRPSWCPIICSLPEGHGRLIDASSKIMVPMGENGELHEMKIDSLLDYVTPFIESAVPAERSETEQI